MTVEIKVIGDTVESFLPSQLRKRIVTRPEDFPNGQFNDQFRIPLECTCNGTRFFSLLPLSSDIFCTAFSSAFISSQWNIDGIRPDIPRDIIIFYSFIRINNIFKLCNSWSESYIILRSFRIENIFDVAKFSLKQLHFLISLSWRIIEVHATYSCRKESTIIDLENIIV